MKVNHKILSFLLIIAVLCLPVLALADKPYSGAVNNLGTFLNGADYGPVVGHAEMQDTILSSISLFITILFSFLGIIFLILVLYGCFLWMTAGGNEEQITKAKKILKDSIIGLIIVLLSYSITYFVLYWVGRGFYNVDLSAD